MKRLLAFFVLCGLIFVFTFFNEFDILGNDKISKVCIVTNSQIASADTNEIKEKFDNLNNVDGIILYFENSSLDDIVDFYNIDYYRGGDVEGKAVYYGYSPYYKENYSVNNKKVNVQISVQENQIIVGFPAILTGF